MKHLPILSLLAVVACIGSAQARVEAHDSHLYSQYTDHLAIDDYGGGGGGGYYPSVPPSVSVEDCEYVSKVQCLRAPQTEEGCKYSCALVKGCWIQSKVCTVTPPPVVVNPPDVIKPPVVVTPPSSTASVSGNCPAGTRKDSSGCCCLNN